MRQFSEHDDNSSHAKLPPNRLEAFSDGVMAIIITITVLELKIPAGSGLQALKPILPLFLTYAVSFQTIGTYWNNHHHLLRATDHVSTGIMWSNLNLLFWLSLIPFSTGWLGLNHSGHLPIALYAATLLMSGLAYTIFQFEVVKHSKNRQALINELGANKKGLASLVSYCLAIIFAFSFPVISYILIVIVALIWFIPDQRIERVL